jgi:large subunit ribosomal protein L9
MKVVFLEEVEGTAHTGDVKNVKDGFARNYLLPRRLAAPANEHYITIANAKATKEARKQVKLDEDAQRLLPQVDGQSLTMEVRVGEQEKMFGSVTAREIAEQLAEQTKIPLEHRQVDLKQPIRELGTFTVPVKLTRNVIANVTVNVIPVGGAVAAEEPAAEEPMIEGVTESGEPSMEPTNGDAEPEAPVDEEPSPAETPDVPEEATPETPSEDAAEEPQGEEGS